jgi:hypothetical protein
MAGQQGVRGVVSFSDPVPRRTAAGDLVFPGHIGTIYQASNAGYLGRTTPRRVLHPAARRGDHCRWVGFRG